MKIIQEDGILIWNLYP